MSLRCPRVLGGREARLARQPWLGISASGREAGELYVELETAGGACSERVHGSKAKITPARLRPKVEILRRHQVLELVEAEPGKRYETIKRFIEIDAFERSEQSLRNLVVSLSAERDDASMAEGQSLATLATLLQSGR